MTADLIDLARAGDGEAFRQLIGPYERELQAHCYRILGSLQDAEDAMQDALLAAWQGLGAFEGRASMRTWLYRVVTTRALNARRSARRRHGMPALPGARLGAKPGAEPGAKPGAEPGAELGAEPGAEPGAESGAESGAEPPEPTRMGEVTWLEPYPDVLLEGLADAEPGPEARYEAREAISLAFIVAVQRVPPRQRAVLILRDVLGFPASEAARILDTTEESVTSALKRARAALRMEPADPPPEPDSAGEKQLIERLTRAYQAGDVDAIIALFADDAWLTMPPAPLEYQGRDMIARFLTGIAFRNGRTYRLIPTRANGQLAFGAYLPAGAGDAAQANGLLVLALSGDRIQAMTRFEASVLPRFGLPPT